MKITMRHHFSKILAASTLVVSQLASATQTFASGGITNPAIGTWGQSPAEAKSGATFNVFLVHFWNVLIQVGALAVLLYFLWGAIEWVTSAGEKGKLESARNRMLHAAIGLLILVGSLVLIGFISFLLFGTEFNILKPVFPTPDAAPQYNTYLPVV
jgi:hypothetical protein